MIFSLDNKVETNMEIILKRFPPVTRKILKNLDNQSLTRSIEAKRGLAEFLDSERFYWIQFIKAYIRNFEGVEESWIEVLHRTPVDVIKQLALTVEEFFNSYLFNQVSPLHIVAKKGTLSLFQFVISRATDKNPSDNHGMTPLQIAAIRGHFDIFKLIIDRIGIKNPANNFGYTPLHFAAQIGHLDICKLIIDNVDDKHPLTNHGFTPKTLAHEWRHFQVSKLFES